MFRGYDRILVTGATGFIGSHLLNRLKEERLQHQTIIGVGRRFTNKIEEFENDFNNGGVFELNCNLNDIIECQKLMSTFQPDLIYHIAGKATTRIEHSLDEKTLIEDNIISTHNLAQFAKNVDIVFTSTVLVHDGLWKDYQLEIKEHTDNGITEKYFIPPPKSTILSPICPHSMYGATKASAELILKASKNVKNANIVRLCAVVGNNLTHGMLRDFVKKANSDSKTFEVYGPKNTYGSYKPYIHISEVVNYLIRNGKSTTLTNNSVFAKDVAKFVLLEMEVEKEIVMSGDDYWPGDTPYINTEKSPDIFNSSEKSIRLAVKAMTSIKNRVKEKEIV